MGIGDRIVHAWDAFKEPDKDRIHAYSSFGANYSLRPDRIRFTGGDRSVSTAIYNRISIDVAAIDMQHVRINDDGQFVETIKSGLNNCLTLEPNLDQASRAFKQDIVMTLFEKGSVAIVPVETSLDPTKSTSYDIKTLRVGEIVSWFPQHVRVSVYNERTGRKEEITLPKTYVAIVENPLYSVMNETNSTLQRLIRKLSLLDSIDEQAGSGKLDMIIQLPYVIKSDARREQAEQRRKDIEVQLKGSQYGIAYTDGTERITQLNRPLENNMLKQVEYLTNMVYGQLGLTADVFDGTASEAVMLNYHNRTIEPILTAITQAMKRTFLTKTARSQLQSIEFYRDPFKLVPVGTIADIADKFARNEVMSSNEIRAKIGLKPSQEPKADKLQNSNMPQPSDANVAPEPAPAEEVPVEEPTDVAQSAIRSDHVPPQVRAYLAHKKIRP